jgi:hypothetical protein
MRLALCQMDVVLHGLLRHHSCRTASPWYQFRQDQLVQCICDVALTVMRLAEVVGADHVSLHRSAYVLT